MGPDWIGLIVRADIQNKAIASVSCIPVREDNHTDRRTIVRTVNEERGAMEHLIKLSNRFGTNLNLSGDKALVLERG